MRYPYITVTFAQLVKEFWLPLRFIVDLSQSGSLGVYSVTFFYALRKKVGSAESGAKLIIGEDFGALANRKAFN